MSTFAIIGIVIAAAIVVFVASAMLLRARAERQIERRRVVGEWSAHRDAADSTVAKARELGADAKAHREEAEEHAALADEHAEAALTHAELAEQLERQVSNTGATAARHESEAKEREEKLG